MKYNNNIGDGQIKRNQKHKLIKICHARLSY